MESRYIGTELKRVHFVHCAIPDISLYGVKTSLTIGTVKLSNPVVILADDGNEAREIADGERILPVAFTDGEGIRVIEADGKEVVLEHGYYLARADDGLMVAKILRYDAKAVPYIPKGEARNAGRYLQQLKMAMFLTNSGDIEAMRSAPIYIA